MIEFPRSLQLFALTTCSLLSAQRTWVVDDSGGPGVDFTDLPPAIAAAASGDRVIVHAGAYQAVTLTRAIQLAGQPGAVVNHGFAIRGIGSGQTCSVSGLEFRGLSSAASVSVQSCLGVVSFVDCAVRHPVWTPQVTDCAAVSLIGCTLDTGITIARSAVAAVRCTFDGYVASYAALDTITGDNAEIDLTACTVHGLDAQLNFYGTSAVTLYRSTITLRGHSQLWAGATSFFPRYSLYGSNNSRAIYDPSVAFIPAPANIQLDRLSIPALKAQSYRIGTTLDIQIESPANNIYALFVALPTAPFSLPWGRQWMDLASETLLVAGIQQSGSTSVPLPVPGNPDLEGRVLMFQALAGPTLNSLSLSNPLALIFRR